ncbi:MAG: queuosine precursor transporter [Actinomycetaceae bacterium]|nr:queuosine precursor transporter [Actinomycetaceae bacterium]
MKKTNENLLLIHVIFVISIVVANIVGCKVINTGLTLFGIPLALSGGAITYAFTFLCTDIIGELWGKLEAQRAVRYGFVGQLFAIALIVLTQYTPTDDAAMQQAYETLLGQSPMFVLGSLCAYSCSQTWDVWIFHKIRARFDAKPSMRWIWNNVSTGTSQIIDTVIYALVAFGIGMGWLFQEGGLSLLLSIILGQYLLKLCLAIIDTPFFYYFTRRTNHNK